ncbi:MAG: THUMP domain-containing class I SAM-dependent RNA methyltransferase [Syntrophorhabdaceae bacterium]
MTEYKLTATSAFGLESTVARELKWMGIEKVSIDNGRISFSGSENEIARTNINLRCADRVLIEAGRFPAMDFEELFQGTRAVRWEDMIPFGSVIKVLGRSVRSQLSSVPAMQSVVKKAIIESMKRKHLFETFPETGPVFAIEASLHKDMATLYLDTTGAGLHKRGYRTGTGEAALKETLAAGLVYLARWKPGTSLVDPFCGSGTIPIEAAMIGRNIAPGINRRFVSEDWPLIPVEIWKNTRQEATDKISQTQLRISASDIDESLIVKARRNARHAGVQQSVQFTRQDARDLSLGPDSGLVICNPPYGERSGDKRSAGELIREMGETFARFPNWTYYIFTGFENFERYFGRSADTNRKLYNGKIKCYFFEYRKIKK